MRCDELYKYLQNGYGDNPETVHFKKNKTKTIISKLKPTKAYPTTSYLISFIYSHIKYQNE